MLRGIWQALNCLSIHATYCVIIAGASPGETKCGLRYVKTAIFCTCGSNNWGTVEDRCVQCCETICKHRILFPSIQHLVWQPQGRPQGKQKCGKNSKNINLCRYFKFNREANCNTSIQTFICPMCAATLCNLCYIVVCVNFLSTFSDKKSCNISTTLQNSVAQFVIFSWAFISIAN